MPAYTGVVVTTHDGVALGFGVSAKAAAELRKAEPRSIVVFHQEDVGLYLRDESTIA